MRAIVVAILADLSDVKALESRMAALESRMATLVSSVAEVGCLNMSQIEMGLISGCPQIWQILKVLLNPKSSDSVQ